MARQGIFTGFTPNDGLGDSLASGAVKVNANFQEIYNVFGDGNNLDINAGAGGTWSKGNGEIGIYTSKYVGINTATPRSNLHVEGNVYLSGITTGRFVGDGSGLTGVTAVGSGVVLKDNGVLIGVAQTINFTNKISIGTVFGGNADVYVDDYVSYANVAGLSTYATTAGLASLSNYTPLAGFSTYATVAGIATYASVAGIVTYAQASGIATNAGNAFYAGIAGVSTYAITAGVSTNAGYATTAGISSVARNLTGSPSITIDNINSLAGIVTIPGQGSKMRFDFDSLADLPSATSWRGMFAYANNVKTAYVSFGNTLGGPVTAKGWRPILVEDEHGNYQTSGVLTAFAFYGDGSHLSNLPGADSLWRSNGTGIHTLGNVGIGTTTASSALTVSGNVKVTGIVTASSFIGTVTGNVIGNVTGNATGLSGSPNLNVGVITATTFRGGTFVGDGSGLTGLVATGTGVEIKDDGVTSGVATTINFGTNISVSFGSGIATVSGVTSVSSATSAYGLAGTPNITVGTINGSTITGTSLNVGSASINGGSVSAISVNANSASIPYINATGIVTAGTTLRVGSGVTIHNNGGASLTGVVTALAFVGDGSGLTNLPGGVGSNNTIGIREEGSNVGTAGTINFVGSGVTATITNGVATVEITVGSSGGSGIGTQWLTTSVGVSTISNVGVGTTNPTSKLTVSGDGRFTGVVTATRFDSVTTGTPVIDSSDLLTINAPVVAISTNLTVGGNVGIGSTIPTSKLQVNGGDIRVGINTSYGLILTSPNGTKYRLIVDNSGVLSTVLVP